MFPPLGGPGALTARCCETLLTSCASRISRQQWSTSGWSVVGSVHSHTSVIRCCRLRRSPLLISPPMVLPTLTTVRLYGSLLTFPPSHIPPSCFFSPFVSYPRIHWHSQTRVLNPSPLLTITHIIHTTTRQTTVTTI